MASCNPKYDPNHDPHIVHVVWEPGERLTMLQPPTQEWWHDWNRAQTDPARDRDLLRDIYRRGHYQFKGPDQFHSWITFGHDHMPLKFTQIWLREVGIVSFRSAIDEAKTKETFRMLSQARGLCELWLLDGIKLPPTVEAAQTPEKKRIALARYLLQVAGQFFLTAELRMAINDTPGFQPDCNTPVLGIDVVKVHRRVFDPKAPLPATGGNWTVYDVDFARTLRGQVRLWIDDGAPESEDPSQVTLPHRIIYYHASPDRLDQISGGNHLQLLNAGILEMSYYNPLDDPDTIDVIQNQPSQFQLLPHSRALEWLIVHASHHIHCGGQIIEDICTISHFHFTKMSDLRDFSVKSHPHLFVDGSWLRYVTKISCTVDFRADGATSIFNIMNMTEQLDDFWILPGSILPLEVERAKTTLEKRKALVDHLIKVGGLFFPARQGWPRLGLDLLYLHRDVFKSDVDQDLEGCVQDLEFDRMLRERAREWLDDDLPGDVETISEWKEWENRSTNRRYDIIEPKRISASGYAG
ncbi:MAG: hypothetical protein M1831_000858 [Alyxoria varia]|nr:MAG: hypothetical protein M1831_000858 [Alyxoria varia]